MRDDDFAPPIDRRRERAARAERRRKTLLGVLGAGVVAFVLGIVVGASSGGGDKPSDAGETAGPPELPRGGRSLLPEYRLVGFYGAPQDDALGELGIGTPKEAGKRLEQQIKPYEGGRPVMPVFELLATIADATPGDDGLYRTRQPHSVIREYLEAVREIEGILLLDIQPGRADFAAEVRRLQRYLEEPDVGLALDPEWHVGPTEIPGDVIGSVSATEVNGVSADLAATVAELDLPEKLFVIHQFTDDMITSKALLEAPEELATVLNVDGFGDPPNKIAKYDELAPRRAVGLRRRLQALLRRGLPADDAGRGPRPQAAAGSDRLRVAPDLEQAVSLARLERGLRLSCGTLEERRRRRARSVSRDRCTRSRRRIPLRARPGSIRGDCSGHGARAPGRPGGPVAPACLRPRRGPARLLAVRSTSAASVQSAGPASNVVWSTPHPFT